MMKEKLGRVFSSKAFYILFAVLASIVLWMFVEFSQNPDTEKIVDNVEVVFLNEDVLRDKNLVITSISSNTVSLTFRGKRGLLPKLNNGTVTVTVDLATITDKGYVSLSYKPVYPADVSERTVPIISKSVDRISLTVDKLAEKTIEVTGRYNGGTASSEYMSGTPDFQPNTITIFGPVDAVSKVDHAWVPILRENLSSTYTEELDFVLRDIGGNELGESVLESITSSTENIRVTVPITMLKEVPLTVNILPGAGAAPENTKVTITPSTITISGAPEAVRDYNSINIGTIDLTKLDITSVEMFPIVIENNFLNESGVTEAIVSVEVLGCEIRYFTTTNLQVVNPPRYHTPTIVQQSVEVRVRGKAEELDAITAANIVIVADLTNYSPGTSQVPAKVLIDGVTGDIGAVGEYKLTVRLERD